MSENANTILVAEDEPEVRDYLGLALNCQGYEVEFAQNGEEVLAHLERDAAKTSLLLLDLVMPYKDGFETLNEVRRGWPSLPVITLSGSSTPANIVTVMKAGALDFLAKPVAHEDLARAVERALSAKLSDNEEEVTGAASVATVSETRLPAPGTWSQQVELLLNRVGAADVPVLLRGETGVGKEVLARKLHEHSRRAGKPFLKLNCAALPSELVESELFGYEKGAFTGAFKNTPGKFEMANTGTILLDEIGDMDFKLQAKLLQVLQDQEFLRLGAKETSRIDVRVMAATHCDLEKAVEDGRFREDLYYRLAIIEINIPPLRERRDEIVALAEVFLSKYAGGAHGGVSPALRDVLLEHDWPGNVRELENVIRKYLVYGNVESIAVELRKRAEKLSALRSARSARVVTMPQASMDAGFNAGPNSRSERALAADGDDAMDSSSVDFAGDGLQRSEDAASGAPIPKASILAEVDQARRKAETDAILRVLNATLWNRKQAAKLLNIDYKALLYKMKKLGIGEKGLPEQEDSSAA